MPRLHGTQKKKITIKGSSELVAGVTDQLPYALMPPTYCLPIGFNLNFQHQLNHSIIAHSLMEY
jgi:hypothetical protein